jgi:hypothetical protein
MPDPALAAGKDHLLAELLDDGVLGIELPLLGQLASQFKGSIWTGVRRGHHLSGHAVESRQKRIRKGPFQHIAGEQGEHLNARVHARGQL